MQIYTQFLTLPNISEKKVKIFFERCAGLEPYPNELVEPAMLPLSRLASAWTLTSHYSERIARFELASERWQRPTLTNYAIPAFFVNTLIHFLIALSDTLYLRPVPRKPKS